MIVLICSNLGMGMCFSSDLGVVMWLFLTCSDGFVVSGGVVEWWMGLLFWVRGWWCLLIVASWWCYWSVWLIGGFGVTMGGICLRIGSVSVASGALGCWQVGG